MKAGEHHYTYCRKCLNDTEHSCVFALDDSETEEVEGGHYLDHSINTAALRCVACSTLQLRVSIYTEPPEWFHEEYVPPHPPRRLPSWARDLPAEVFDLMKEIYVALGAGQLWLAAMGTRTLIDMFIVNRVGDQGNFKRGLARLKDEGFLGTKDILVLEQALELGHAATHRLRKPTLPECTAALDIVESLLNRLTLSERASLLSENLSSSRRSPPPAKPSSGTP